MLMIAVLAGCQNPAGRSSAAASGAATSEAPGTSSAAVASPAAGTSGGTTTAAPGGVTSTGGGVVPQAVRSAAPTPVPSPPTPGPAGFAGFTTPSHNIGCYVDAGDGSGGEARCDIDHADWTPPPKPASCPLAWGPALVVTAEGAAFGCIGDSARNDDVVPYGTVVTRGAFTCAVEQTGVTCTDLATGHGFAVSRASYRLF